MCMLVTQIIWDEIPLFLKWKVISTRSCYSVTLTPLWRRLARTGQPLNLHKWDKDPNSQMHRLTSLCSCDICMFCFYLSGNLQQKQPNSQISAVGRGRTQRWHTVTHVTWSSRRGRTKERLFNKLIFRYLPSICKKNCTQMQNFMGQFIHFFSLWISPHVCFFIYLVFVTPLMRTWRTINWSLTF